MRILLAFLIVLLPVLSGCSNRVTGSNDGSNALFGWRSTGLILDDRGSAGGFHKLTHIGDVLFAMDSRTSSETIRPYHWRIWMGHVGSNHWDSLPMPNGNVPNCWVVQNNKLIVGTKYTGEIWSYDPSASLWSRITSLPKPGAPDSLFQISFVGIYGSNLVAGMLVNSTNHHYCWEGSASDTVGETIPCVGKLHNIMLGQVLEFGGYLYGFNYYYGVYRYRDGDTAWESLSSPRGRSGSEYEYASILATHNGHLFLGYTDYEDGLYRMNDDGTWTLMTPRSDSLSLTEAPRDIRALESYRGRLYMGGTNYSTPKVWTPTDSTNPKFGDWRNLPDGWCRSDVYGCGYQTWGIMGVGDTLYAIGWGFAAKVPLVEIDSMAVLEYDSAFYK